MFCTGKYCDTIFKNHGNCRREALSVLHVKKPIHKRDSVWYEFRFRGIIRQFFLQNEQGVAITMSSHNQRISLQKKLKEEDTGNS